MLFALLLVAFLDVDAAPSLCSKEDCPSKVRCPGLRAYKSALIKETDIESFCENIAHLHMSGLVCKGLFWGVAFEQTRDYFEVNVENLHSSFGIPLLQDFYSEIESIWSGRDFLSIQDIVNMRMYTLLKGPQLPILFPQMLAKIGEMAVAFLYAGGDVENDSVNKWDFLQLLKGKLQIPQAAIDFELQIYKIQNKAIWPNDSTISLFDGSFESVEMWSKQVVSLSLSTSDTCKDNNFEARTSLVLFATSDRVGNATECEKLVMWLETRGAGCEMSNPCCETCQKLQNRQHDTETMNRMRAFKTELFLQLVGFTFMKDYQTEVLDRMQFFYKPTTTVEVVFAGKYSDYQSIGEYFILQNPFVTNWVHYIWDVYHHDIVEANDTFLHLVSEAQGMYTPYNKSRMVINDTMELQWFYQDAFDTKPSSGIVNFRDGPGYMAETFSTNLEFCIEIQNVCTSEYEQFKSVDNCVQFMDSLPKCSSECPRLAGNTLNCRHTHFILARKNFRPELHCFHVGPGRPDANGLIKCSAKDCLPHNVHSDTDNTCNEKESKDATGSIVPISIAAISGLIIAFIALH